MASFDEYDKDYASDIVNEQKARQKRQDELSDFNIHTDKAEDEDSETDFEYQVEKNRHDFSEDYSFDVLNEIKARTKRDQGFEELKVSDVQPKTKYEDDEELDGFQEKFEQRHIHLAAAANKPKQKNVDKIQDKKPAPATNKKAPKSTSGELDIDSLIDYDEQKTKQKNFKNLPEDLDLDSLLSYDDEIRKQKSFREDFQVEGVDETTSDQELLQRSFRDFLLSKKLAGKNKGYPHNTRIPSNQLNLVSKEVEITDDPKIASHDKSQATILIERNAQDIITNIEVICSCGERTVISLEYDSSMSHISTTDIDSFYSDSSIEQKVLAPTDKLKLNKLEKFDFSKAEELLNDDFDESSFMGAVSGNDVKIDNLENTDDEDIFADSFDMENIENL